jgi:hypothetical protein
MGIIMSSLRCCILRASVQSTSHAVNYNTQTLGKYISSHVVLIIKHQNLLSQMARGPFSLQSGDKSKIRDKFWNIIHHIMNGEVMNVVIFMMRQLNDLKMDKNHNLAYAPYIMALIKAKTRFEGRWEIAHTPFRPFKNEIGFLTRPLTPFPDDEEEAGNDEEVAPEADAAEQMPPPPPPPQPEQFWQPGPGYFDPYFQHMQQGLQTHMMADFRAC